jgi:protocatechuate 3,4-dioxygenase beta subunit
LSGAPVRSNIVETEQGIKTTLTLTVVDTSCKAIKGATVDIWHTNAAGEYSGVDGNSGIYLRGSQITNAKGQVTFTTIFPGWYPQRTMHIHFKVWRDGKEVLTSQLFASDTVTTKIYAMAPYAARGNQAVNNARDGIYRGYGSSISLVTMKVAASTKRITASAKIVI